MNMILHRGGELVDLEAVRILPTPPATETHHPLPHATLVDMVRFSLQYFGHEVVEEHHALTPEGDSYFGLLTLKTNYGDFSDAIALRNNHTKKFPAGISFGSRVFVCDNLALSGDTVVSKRHTKNLRHQLPSIIAGIVEPLRLQRERQHEQFARYQALPLQDSQVNDLIMGMYRKGAINVTAIPDVLGAYENPPHDWGDRNAWRLFNATTYALKGKVADNPQSTRTVHDLIDGVCERLN